MDGRIHSFTEQPQRPDAVLPMTGPVFCTKNNVEYGSGMANVIQPRAEQSSHIDSTTLAQYLRAFDSEYEKVGQDGRVPIASV